MKVEEDLAARIQHAVPQSGGGLKTPLKASRRRLRAHRGLLRVLQYGAVKF